MSTKVIKEKLTQNEILKFLLDVDKHFKPEPISKRVNLDEYAEKLSTFANHFYVKEDESIIGMSCCYMNDPSKEKIFVSITCVDYKYLGKGIGRRLTNEYEKEAIKEGFKAIEFEVHIDNLPSIEMHKKLGFSISRKNNEFYYIMRKEL